MSLLSDYEEQQAPKHGLILLQVLVLLLFCLFTVRFWYLQIHKGAQFAELARDNQMRQEPLYAPRGQLLDRSNELLAVNQPAYALALVREECADVEATLRRVGEWTGMDYEVLRKKYEIGRKRVKPFAPMILVSDISYDLLARIEANSVYWPGLEIIVRPRRFYAHGRALAHILGYVADANEEELEKDQGLALGDIVGKQGLEYILEKRLRGAKGEKMLEVDATGRALNNRILREPVAGEEIKLSIDLGLQEFAVKQLEGQSGGVVVLEPYSGQVLALVTQPSYDNNAFASGLSKTEWANLQKHPRKPLQNRVIQSVYPPGSVWKLLMAACGLHEGVIDWRRTFFCSGSYSLGKRVFRCWKSGGHGAVNLRQALIHSCDVYFYQLGEKLGVDRISKYAFACGFGERTGIDLPHENQGLVPTREWKKKRFGEVWHGGENLNLAIGQGYTLVHPLQVARFIAALVNGGRIVKPNLTYGGGPVVQGKLPLSDENRLKILEAMENTVSQGTARRIFRPDAKIGGKTGTAQVVRIEQVRKKAHDMPYDFRDHAWLATWGVKNEKSYVVVVMVEHGGHGGAAAGPLVKAIYDYLFGEAGKS